MTVRDGYYEYNIKFGIPGQIVHGGVNLLVHFYEGKVGIRTEVEAQADDACTIARLAVHVLQFRHLDELLPQRFHHRIL